MVEENPFRQFYEQGGYVDGGKPTDDQRKRLLMWASQYMAKGGSVPSSKGSIDQLMEAMIALHRACGGRV